MQPPANNDFGITASPYNAVASAMTQQVGTTILGKVVPFASQLWLALRYYFDVNNSYVQNKLRVLLAPYRHKQWSRLRAEDTNSPVHDPNSEAGKGLAPPVNDINAPDLYLPVMSFITFVLITGLLKGTKKSFTPEVLNQITGSCLVTQLLEIGIIKLCMYLLDHASLPFLDLVAFTGYKYINLVINTFVGLFFGSALYYVALLYTGTVAVMFMANTLRSAIPEHSHIPANAKRNYLLIGISCLQFVLIWWLGYSGDL